MRSKFEKEFVGLYCKFFWKPLKVSHSNVFSRWSIFSPQGIYLKTQFNLSSFSLNIRQRCTEKPDCFLLRKSQAMVCKPSTLRRNIQSLCGWKKGINKINRFTISHCQLESDCISRSSSIPSKFPLDTHVALGINHTCQIPKLPLFQLQCYNTVHTHRIP